MTPLIFYMDLFGISMNIIYVVFEDETTQLIFIDTNLLPKIHTVVVRLGVPLDKLIGFIDTMEPTSKHIANK